MNKNHLLEKAIIFAAERHAGQVRKGTNIPYITHPMEVLVILTKTNDIEIMIAGVLHDTLEDITTTIEEIEELFGPYIARLVAAHSEDKSKSWLERKTHAIEELKFAQIDVKTLALADKLSNMRSMYMDYKLKGDELWERFNAGKQQQAWYYGIAQMFS